MSGLPGSDLERIAVFGGVYSNHLALSEAIADAGRRGAEAILCLGDLGAFGPNPDRIFPLLRDAGIPVVKGNYDDSIARGLDDCQCGYTDPMDNHYARLSYRYTYEKTSPAHRQWLGTLPGELRFTFGGLRVLACHGSPRSMNEFLWESQTSTHFLRKMADDHDCDVILGTHTGLHWSRRIGEGMYYVNVGALGRPANDGTPRVWYAMLDAGGVGEAGSSGVPGARARELVVDFVPVAYDHEALAEEMVAEGLPSEFVETIRSGWWTTCLEVLPGKERARGRY